MNIAVLITGGNLGDVKMNCLKVAEIIGDRVGRITKCSSMFESCAWGFESEDMFVNQVLEVETDLLPEQLLEATQQIERELGRDKPAEVVIDDNGARVYASRTMDIDILFYNDTCIESEQLTIPHPMLHLRDFVLEPLSEIEADYVHPKLLKSVEELKQELKTKETIYI